MYKYCFVSELASCLLEIVLGQDGGGERMGSSVGLGPCGAQSLIDALYPIIPRSFRPGNRTH